jgi:hypothetical protein
VDAPLNVCRRLPWLRPGAIGPVRVVLGRPRCTRPYDAFARRQTKGAVRKRVPLTARSHPVKRQLPLRFMVRATGCGSPRALLP